MGGRGLRIVVNSKSVFNEITSKYGLPIGKRKCERVMIPKVIAQNWKLARHAIRGIVDTDGSIFVSDKPKRPNYPSIEITTCSSALTEQIVKILSERKFRVTLRSDKRENRLCCYRIGLNGVENIRKWMKEIGFSNPVKRAKAEEILKRDSIV